MSNFVSNHSSSGADKLLPHSIESEKSVLGALLIDLFEFDKLKGLLVEGDFYLVEHRIIYGYISKVAARGMAIEMSTLFGCLEQYENQENIGWFDYINLLKKAVLIDQNILPYAEEVREKSILRKIIQISNEMSDLAFNPAGNSARQILEDAANKIKINFEYAPQKIHGLVSISEVLHKVVSHVETMYSGMYQAILSGLSTGFENLDSKTLLLNPGDLVIVDGSHDMGKTAFAISIAERVAIDSGLPVSIFSMGMSGEKFVRCMVGFVGNIDQGKLHCGDMKDDDWSKLTKTLEILHEAPIFIDETAKLNVLDIGKRARRILHENSGLGLIIIDYLQLIASVKEKKNGNGDDEIAEIMQSLKVLAKELHVPIIILSQFVRTLENRKDERPMMWALCETDVIVQNADIIIFLHRDELYNSATVVKGNAEIIITKNRE